MGDWGAPLLASFEDDWGTTLWQVFASWSQVAGFDHTCGGRLGCHLVAGFDPAIGGEWVSPLTADCEGDLGTTWWLVFIQAIDGWTGPPPGGWY